MDYEYRCNTLRNVGGFGRIVGMRTTNANNARSRRAKAVDAAMYRIVKPLLEQDMSWQQITDSINAADGKTINGKSWNKGSLYRSYKRQEARIATNQCAE